MSFRLGYKHLPKVGRYSSPHSVRTRTLFTRGPNTARNVLSATALVTGTALCLVYYFDSRSALHRYVLTPILRKTLDAETSHRAAVRILGSGWGPKDKGVDDECLAVEVCLCLSLCLPNCSLRVKCISYGESISLTRLGWLQGSTRMERRLTACLTLALAGSKWGA